MDKERYKEKLSDWAEILKAIGHPTRLCIICRLLNEDLNVSQMQECLEIPQSTVSQNVAILKSKGIIKGQRRGVEIVYSLINDDVRKIVNVFFDEHNFTIK
ncbi:ArsR/SmtB family transcription factor [Haloimpatiens sp. FM7330]|uniref:ArsR/SmtB family transcription factor n=1 Tax=Haloimpatiens sp. FM7330 TaxID=3298610 RepID=UPI00362E9EA1